MSALSPGMTVVLLTGERDDNTLARFNQKLLDNAHSRDVNAKMMILSGVGHGSVIDSPHLTEQTLQLLKETK